VVILLSPKNRLRQVSLFMTNSHIQNHIPEWRNTYWCNTCF